MISKRFASGDLVCEAIAASIHHPNHLAHCWVMKYGFLRGRINSLGLRNQLICDFRDTYKEMKKQIELNESRWP